MKNRILILLACAALTGCFDQSREGCPADMFLTFGIDDPHEPATYDARVGGDVMLYLFKDKRVVSGTLVPYGEISHGKEYVIRKTGETSRNLDLLAFAVLAGGDASLIPQLSAGDHLDDIHIRLAERTRAGEVDCRPTQTHLHMARITSSEAIDRETKHDLGLNHSECRMEVHITDNNAVMSQSGSDPKVCVYGTMTHMDMDGNGRGEEAAVHVGLTCPASDGVTFTTGRFGVMPSAGEQTVSVVVSDGASEVAHLTVPRSALPQGAVSGGLIVFEYTLDAPEFTIVVDGFRQNIVITDM